MWDDGQSFVSQDIEGWRAAADLLSKKLCERPDQTGRWRIMTAAEYRAWEQILRDARRTLGAAHA
jgi:hypothetical protein